MDTKRILLSGVLRYFGLVVEIERVHLYRIHRKPSLRVALLSQRALMEMVDCNRDGEREDGRDEMKDVGEVDEEVGGRNILDNLPARQHLEAGAVEQSIHTLGIEEEVHELEEVREEEERDAEEVHEHDELADDEHEDAKHSVHTGRILEAVAEVLPKSVEEPQHTKDEHRQDDVEVGVGHANKDEAEGLLHSGVQCLRDLVQVREQRQVVEVHGEDHMYDIQRICDRTEKVLDLAQVLVLVPALEQHSVRAQLEGQAQEQPRVHSMQAPTSPKSYGEEDRTECSSC